MKYYTIIILLLLAEWSLRAQCPAGDVLLSTQAEVDALVANYPNCTEITGNLQIGDLGSDINDISGLSGLTSVGGYLYIKDNDELLSLNGLSDLTSVGGFLDIRGNSSLTSLSGLSGLTSVGGDLTILANSPLSSLSGLSSLTSIGGDLRISFNNSLSSLTGLENIDATTITDLRIQNNAQLSTCAISSICAYLGVEMNIATITFNATDCDSREEVEMACTAGSVGNLCTEAIEVNVLLGQGVGIPQTSMLLNNTGFTAGDTPGAGFECHFQMDAISNSLWVNFTGDGNTYRFTTVMCSAGADDFLPNTQFSLYSGACDNLTPEACNEDQDAGSNILNAEIDQFTTVAGTEYFLLIDGYDGLTGEFCLEVTQQMTVSATDISQTNIELFPNPTTGQLQLRNIVAERIEVFNGQGQHLIHYQNPGQLLDLSPLPAGVYHLQLIAADGTYVSKVVKQ